MRITDFAREKQIAALGWYCLLSLILCLAATDGYAASFDCKKAKTGIEKMICEDAELSRFDEELAGKYKKALSLVSYREQMKRQQQAWLKTLRDACKDETCLAREYRDRIAALNSTLAAATFKRKPEDPRAERERVVAVAKKLKWEKPYDWKEGDQASLAKKQFCEGLLSALQSRKDVEFVEPIVRTDDYNDPKLQAYLGKCPKLKPLKGVQWQPNVLEMLEEQNYPQEEWEDYGTIYYASLDFKLYHIDFDGNPENGKEYLFYGGGGYEYKYQGATTFSEYRIMNLTNCKDLGSRQVLETVNFKSKKQTNDTNGIIQYKGNFYIYEYRYPDSDDRSMRICHWDTKSISRTSTACWFE